MDHTSNSSDLTGIYNWFSPLPSRTESSMPFASSSSVFDSPDKMNDLQAQFRTLNMAHPNLTIAQLDLLTPEEPALNPWDYCKPTPQPFVNNYAYNQHRNNSLAAATATDYYAPEPSYNAEPRSSHTGAIPKRPILAPITIPPPPPTVQQQQPQPYPMQQQSYSMGHSRNLQSPPLLSDNHIRDLLSYLQEQENAPADPPPATESHQFKWFDRPHVPQNQFDPESPKLDQAAAAAGASCSPDPNNGKAAPKFSMKFVELLLQLKKMTEIGLLDRELLDQPLSPVTLSMIYNIVMLEKRLDDLRRECPMNYCEQEMTLKQREDILRKEIRAEQTSYLASLKTRMQQKFQQQQQPQYHHLSMEHNLPRKW